MKHRNKLILWMIASFVYLLIYFGIGGPNSLYSVYSFGFLEDPSRFASGPETAVSEYISSMHELSPSWTTYIEMLQLMTGKYDVWRYLIPTPIIIGVLAIAVLNDVQIRHKWIIALAVVAGPLGIVGYSFVFERDAVDIILMLTFLLILRASFRDEKHYYTLITTFFSFVFWIHHYTFWPLFATTVMVLTVLSRWHPNITIRYHSLVSLFIPAVLYTVVSTIYFGSLSTLLVLLKGGLSDFIAVITTFYYGQFTNIPSSAIIVSSSESPSPAWMPTILYLAYTIPLAAISLVILWGHSTKIRELISRKTNVDLSIHLLLFSSVIAGATVTAGIYIVRGYLYRVFVFWPVALPFILWTALKAPFPKTTKLTPNRGRQIIFIALILVVTLHFSPVLVYSIHPQEQAPGTPNSQQFASAKHTSQIQSDHPIYTDLLHVGPVLEFTNNTYIKVGTGTVTETGDVAITRGASMLYGYHSPSTHSYVLITQNDIRGTRIWGAVIQPPSDGPEWSRVYSNGQDAIYSSHSIMNNTD